MQVSWPEPGADNGFLVLPDKDGMVPTAHQMFGNQDGYYPAVVEAALDALCMQIQQLQAQVSRCVQQPLVDTVVLNALPAAFLRQNKKLGFDANGQLALF